MKPEELNIGDIVIYGELLNNHHIVKVVNTKGESNDVFKGETIGGNSGSKIGTIHTKLSIRAFRKYDIIADDIPFCIVASNFIDKCDLLIELYEKVQTR